MTKFDFEDGNGTVPAHRHTNPDGSIGGWVADTASVASTVWVGYEAQVFGNAQVLGNAWVGIYAKVYGNAKLFDNAQIFDDARICGNAMVFGNAKVFGDAILESGEWFEEDVHTTPLTSGMKM